MKLQNTTAIPDYVESMGFDNALREIALYAEICANGDTTNSGNGSYKRTFYRVMAEIAKCADNVEALLVNPESITIGLEQFQPKEV